MISVNAGLLADLNRSFIARFKRGLKRAPTFWQQVAQREVSSTSQSIYPFLGATGTLREWVGDRVAEELKVYDFAIKNRHFEKTLRVKRDLLADDQFGFYGTEAEQLGDAANRHPDKLIASLIEGGFVNLGYDAVAFFATTHPTASGGTWSNKGTTALSATSYGVARIQMQTLTDDGGEILDINPDTLVVPPGLEEMANSIVGPTPPGALAINPWSGTAKVVVVRRLADANNWYLFDSTQVVKPFIMQFREDPKIVSQTNLTDESVFRRNEFLWGVDYRGEAGYGLPQLAFGAIVA